MHRLMGQHWLTDDISDGENMRHICAHLLVDRNKALLSDLHTGLFGADRQPVGLTANRHEHLVEHMSMIRCFGTIEGDFQPLVRLPRPQSLWCLK